MLDKVFFKSTYRGYIIIIVVFASLYLHSPCFFSMCRIQILKSLWRYTSNSTLYFESLIFPTSNFFCWCFNWFFLSLIFIFFSLTYRGTLLMCDLRWVSAYTTTYLFHIAFFFHGIVHVVCITIVYLPLVFIKLPSHFADSETINLWAANIQGSMGTSCEAGQELGRSV